MSGKKKKPAAQGPVWHMSAEEATLAALPHFNAHACGTGPHGSTKYDRAREKRAWRKELRYEGVRESGRLRCLAEIAHAKSEAAPYQS